MDPILDDLNPAQREAVEYGEGPLMVLAGAGSGKTRVITRRIARLLRDGVPASSILGLTFTNKAAGEMQRRVLELGGSRVQLSTFHSACARFLRSCGHRLGYPRDFSIYDTYDRDTCIKLLMEELSVPGRKLVKPAQIGRAISRLKNHGIAPEEFDPGYTEIDVIVDAVYRSYQQRMLQLGAMDFDDLLLNFLAVMQQEPEVAAEYQSRFRWVLVDEFQDTNRVQYDLVRQLTGDLHNICVVGDPDQSIYSFRGADIRNLLEFEQDYPGTATIVLEQNYRSTVTILHAAETLIRNNLRRKDKLLRTENAEGEPLGLLVAADPKAESREVAQRILDLLGRGVSLAEIAIFYRTHFLSRALEEALRRLSVEYEIVGGLSFFERREIKDLLAYLRIIVNPLDDISMGRIINVPPRGVGKATVEKLRVIASAEGMALSEVIAEPALLIGLQARARKSLAALAELILEAREIATAAAPPLKKVLQAADYVSHACGLGEPEDVAREENIDELLADAATFDEEHDTGLAGYLAHVSLLTSEDRRREAGPRISLMTVHAAKGLEFDHVMAVGIEDGLFPHSRSIDSDDDIEEERRLMYVALTRARKTVWLSRSQSRMNNQGLFLPQEPSRFLAEIPSECFGGAAESSRHWEADE